MLRIVIWDMIFIKLSRENNKIILLVWCKYVCFMALNVPFLQPGFMYVLNKPYSVHHSSTVHNAVMHRRSLSASLGHVREKSGIEWGKLKSKGVLRTSHDSFNGSFSRECITWTMYNFVLYLVIIKPTCTSKLLIQ